MSTILESNITALHGDKGRLWLLNLPTLVRSLADLWELTEIHPVNTMTYHFVAAAQWREKPVILKIGLDQTTLKREFDALKVFEGHGCVKALRMDSNYNALLLERASPGHSLKEYFLKQEDEAIHITCDVIRQLQRASLPETHTFPLIQDWLSILDNIWPLPEDRLIKARQLRDTLLASSPSPILLHADLHHDNIISKDNGWVAIDPHGVIGDPAYEAAAFIRNPLIELQNHPNATEIIHNRLYGMAKFLDISPKRLGDWSYVQAMLGACWALEDNQDPAFFLKMTDLMLKQ